MVSIHPHRVASLLAVVLAFSLTGCATAPVRPTNNPLGNPPGMVDQLVLIDTPEELAQGTRKNVNLAAESSPHLVLFDPANRGYPREGIWESDENEAEFPFTELVPSWNVTTPPNTGIRFEVRTKDQKIAQWSPWLFVGYWGRILESEKKEITFEGGKVYLDNLVLQRPATHWQIRTSLQSFDTDLKVNPSIRRVAIAYSGIVEDAKKREELSPTTKPIAGKIDLPVPFRAQYNTTRGIRGQGCSPTSTTMVLAYWGIDKPIVENAMAIWDNDFDLFGNWGRAVARAGELGLDAWLQRFRNWDDVKYSLSQGTPVIASIKFKKGEFPSHVLKSTAGHLIVIRGMTADGDIICNDPASRTKGNGIVYKAAELGHAWFDHGGVGYVIKGKTPATRPSVVQAQPEALTTQIVSGK